MVDPRVRKVAGILVDYCVNAKKGEHIRVQAQSGAKELINEVCRRILQKGAYPVTVISVPGSDYVYYKNASREQLSKMPEVGKYIVEKCDASITLGGEENLRELTSINSEKIALRRKTLRPLQDITIKKDRWVLFEYPTKALAREAGMSLEKFEDFVYGACIKDWKKETKKLIPLKKAIDKGNKVRIKAPETDLSFSIKGRLAAISKGKHNMPDGEVWTAPVESTVNGYIKYSFPAMRDGKEVSGIRLEFKNGKVIRATAEKNEALLKSMIKMDKGASYIGELGIGTNYSIKQSVKKILFDEKIGGTIHLALGNAYKECRGTNKSALHWDMVRDMRDGGELYIDGKLIQKNGKFLI
jgi:aminopeptidase